MTKRKIAVEERPYHHGDLRRALIEAALREVKAHGVEAFSLRRVATTVGVSPSAAYRHFPDKNALLAAVAEEGFTTMGRSMARSIERAREGKRGARAAAAAFEATGAAYVRFAVAHPEHFRVMFAGRHGSPPADLTDEHNPYTLLVSGLDALVEHGVVPPSRREGAELIAWPAVHGLAALIVGGAIDPDAYGGLDALIAISIAAVDRALTK